MKTNSELVEHIKSLPENSGATIRLGEFESGTIGYPEEWKDLIPRIIEHLRIKNRVHRRYYGCRYFPSKYYKISKVRIRYAYLYPSKRNNHIIVDFWYEEKSDSRSISWCCSEDIKISDFCDPEFERKHMEKEREMRKRSLDKSIDRLLANLGKLLMEQDKIKKEEEGN